MKKKSRDNLEPKAYLPSKYHPDYSKELSHYIGSHFSQPSSLGHKLERASYYLENINRSGKVWEKIPEDEIPTTEAMKQEFYSMPEEMGSYAIEAVKELGTDALRLHDGYKTALRKNHQREYPSEISRSIETLDQLGAAVIRIIETWQAMIRFGSPSVKRRAEKQLKGLLKALIPETRGKRKGGLVIAADELKSFYYEELFRLYHIKNALRSHSGYRSERVRLASVNFEMPVETIRELWNLDGNDCPQARPISLKEMARILTAQYYGITQPRVSNILAS